MKLQTEDFKNLLNQILESYPDINDLEILVRTELDKNLYNIAGGNNNKQKVFQLIQWSESEDKLTKQLIKALVEDRPQNQFFQEINKKLNSGILRTMIEPSSDNAQPITLAEWNQLYLILKQINDNQLITQICKETLKNNQNDLLGNCLELNQNIDLQSLKNILLTRFPKRNDNVPTILEFAERLSSKVTEQLDKKLELEQWIKAIANNLNIALPTYSKSPFNNNIDNIYRYFLLITIIPQGKNQFKLESDLLLYDSSKDSYQPIPKLLNSEIECDFTEIKDQVFCLVQIYQQDYLQLPYILNIQLFLTCRYLGHTFDLEKIVIDPEINYSSCLGNEYPLLVSAYERFSNKPYYNEFLVRWQIKVENTNLAQLIACLQDLERETYNNQNLNQLVNQWIVNEIIGIKIIGCWSDAQEEQENLFYAIARSGIPLALWIRCNNLPNCQDELNNVLKSEGLRNWHDLFKRVWDCRRSAYENPQQLGYHLGILSDDPRRIPSHFKPLIETGK